MKETKMEKNFKINTNRKRMQQDFDAETIEVIKAGKKINVYQSIQENREDTEIYPTLEKYGCIEDTIKAMEKNKQEIYQDLRGIKDLRGVLQQQQEAQNLWDNLPLEVRREFGHNSNEFMEKGENWLKNKIDAEIKANQPIIKTPIIKDEVKNG